jgi:phosphoribosylformylglycinamidine synthase subunit PurL
MWSEHCSHKSSRLHLKSCPRAAAWSFRGPGENAGIIDVGGGYVAAFKIESHNHPSYTEPFQGAATGVGGILRDILTVGARPSLFSILCVFGPSMTRAPASPIAASCTASCPVSRITAIASASRPSAANASLSGAPKGNPLVNVFGLGVARKEDIFYARAGGTGSPVIYVGAPETSGNSLTTIPVSLKLKVRSKSLTIKYLWIWLPESTRMFFSLKLSRRYSRFVPSM